MAGTQIGYSPAHIQAGLDFVDAHSYWQHPAFPGRSWDMQDWYVNNLALVNEAGGDALAAGRDARGGHALHGERVQPSSADPLRRGRLLDDRRLRAFQGWDGIYSFAYSHNDKAEPGKLDGFFDIKSDPSKLVHMPACAAIFLRGDVAPARTSYYAPLSPDDQRKKLHETQSAWNLTAGDLGVDLRQSLVHGIGLNLGKPQVAGRPKEGGLSKLPAKQASFVSDTGQLHWEVGDGKSGYFIAAAPRTRLFTGFVRGRDFQLGDVCGQDRTARGWIGPRCR